MNGDVGPGRLVVIDFVYEDDPNRSKRRPALVWTVEDGYAVALALKVTSHAPRTWIVGEVPLSRWKEAGLRKPSCVRCSKVAQVPLEELGKATRIGWIAPEDMAAVANGVRQCSRSFGPGPTVRP